jgi:hypothetical protein
MKLLILFLFQMRYVLGNLTTNELINLLALLVQKYTC